MVHKLALIVAVLLLGFVALTLFKSRQNDMRAEQEHPPVGAFLNVDGTRVHYLRQGSGPVVILIHGAGGNIKDFTLELTGKLTPDYTVIAFDRPGHGYTDVLDSKGASPAEQATLLAKAADQLGIENAIIAGYSYGGAVALAWALERPEMVDGLVLMSAVSNPWVKPPSFLYELAAGRFTGPIFAKMVSAYAPQSLIQDTMASVFAPQKPPQGYLEHVGPGLTMRAKTLRANGLQVHSLLPHIREQSKYYQRLTMPVEIIHGGKDTTVPASVHSDVLAKQLPHAIYTFMPDLGHDTQHYAQAEILAALKRIAR